MPPTVPVIANVTAQPHDGPEAIRARLVEQVTSSVRWEESMRYLLAQGFTRFIELGPGRALSGFHEAHRQDRAGPQRRGPGEPGSDGQSAGGVKSAKSAH